MYVCFSTDFGVERTGTFAPKAERAADQQVDRCLRTPRTAQGRGRHHERVAGLPCLAAPGNRRLVHAPATPKEAEQEDAQDGGLADGCG